MVNARENATIVALGPARVPQLPVDVRDAAPPVVALVLGHLLQADVLAVALLAAAAVPLLVPAHAAGVVPQPVPAHAEVVAQAVVAERQGQVAIHAQKRASKTVHLHVTRLVAEPATTPAKPHVIPFVADCVMVRAPLPAQAAAARVAA